MKQSIFTLIAAGLCITMLHAQAPNSGKITYEGMRQIDRSQMRTGSNGQEVRPRVDSPGSPDAPEGVPDVMNFTQKLVFAGTMAKEERDRPQNMMSRRAEGGPDGAAGSGAEGRPRGQRMTPPFGQTTFLDLANRQRIDVLTVRQDSVTQTYRSGKPIPTVSDWTASGKTKKIAGYTCYKATATRRKEPYTIWYTTDLPFTYSPVADLTPPTGVVLQIESDSESFKATSVSMEAVAEASVQPPKDAKAISAEEMEQMRRKGMADFRQRMMQNGGFSGAGRN